VPPLCGSRALRGPGFKDVDLAVFRDFTFKERYAIQARLESLNVFNMVSQLQCGLRFTF
jgi:hypothetical protein